MAIAHLYISAMDIWSGLVPNNKLWKMDRIVEPTILMPQPAMNNLAIEAGHHEMGDCPLLVLSLDEAFEDHIISTTTRPYVAGIIQEMKKKRRMLQLEFGVWVLIGRENVAANGSLDSRASGSVFCPECNEYRRFEYGHCKICNYALPHCTQCYSMDNVFKKHLENGWVEFVCKSCGHIHSQKRMSHETSSYECR